MRPLHQTDQSLRPTSTSALVAERRAGQQILHRGPTLRCESDRDIGGSALREWVHRAKADAGSGVAGALTSDEREELSRLRRENKRTAMDLEIFERAAEFLVRRNP